MTSKIDFESQILVLFDSLPLIQNSKFNNFLWVCCWFLCKNLSNFVPKFENSTTRIAILVIIRQSSGSCQAVVKLSFFNPLFMQPMRLKAFSFLLFSLSSYLPWCIDKIVVWIGSPRSAIIPCRLLSLFSPRKVNLGSPGVQGVHKVQKL